MGSCDADSAILSNRGMGVRADSEDIAGTGERVSEVFHHNRVQHAIAEHEQRGDLRGRKWRPCKVQNIEEVRVPFSVEWREVQGIESDRVVQSWAAVPLSDRGHSRSLFRTFLGRL